MGEEVLYFLAALVLSWPMTVVHEVGHWVAAWSVGLPVLEMQIGSGQELRRLTLGGVRVVFNRVPLGGRVRTAYYSQKLHRNLIVLLGGVAAEMVPIAALWDVGPRHDLSRYLIAMALSNLLPLTYRSGGRRVRTDGYQILIHFRHHLSRQGGRVEPE